MAVINMSKNQKINMVKDDGSAIKNIFIGVRWDMNKYAGESDIDFDIHGFLTNEDKKVQYPKDIVNYNTYGDGSGYPWIESNFMENTSMNTSLFMQINSQRIKQILQFVFLYTELFSDYRILEW